MRMFSQARAQDDLAIQGEFAARSRASHLVLTILARWREAGR